MEKLKQILIILFIVAIGLFLLKGCSKGASDTDPKDPSLLSGFENTKTWGVSPEKGFDIKLSKKHVTQGKYSLEVKYPKWDLPSLNTKRLRPAWGKYEEWVFDVFNPQKEKIDFRIRIDDTNGARKNVTRELTPGKNTVRVSADELSSKIDPKNIKFVVLYIQEPQERYTLFFDNMHLVGPDVMEDVLTAKPDFETEKKENVITPLVERPAIEFRKAVELKEDPAPKTGEVKIALAKLKNTPDNQPFISSGIPFAPGQLTDVRHFIIIDEQGQEMSIATKVLARWPSDNSIRSVLVQFDYKIDKLFEYVTLKWGAARTLKNKKIVEPTWRFPEGMIILPSQWLCASGVIGAQVPMTFRDYDKQAGDKFAELIKRPKTGSLRRDGYYSNAHTYYQLYVRGGELRYFVEGRKELLHYRESEIQLDGKNRGRAKVGREPRYIYMQAMLDDYLLTGDPRTLEVAGFMAEYLKNNFSSKKAFYPKGSKNFWTERVIAFPFLGLVTYYEMALDKEYLRLADEYMKNLYKTQMLWPSRGGFIHNLYAHDPEEGARPDEYGGSPFMTGLLLEAIIKYHRITKSEIAADSIFRSVDWLINEGLTPNGDTFKYMTAEKYSSSGGHPDLNMLIVHAFGYAYRLSGYEDDRYLLTGEKLFEKGVADAYLSRRKQFNQNYRSSGHYLAYIQGGLEKHFKKVSEVRRIIREAPEIPTPSASVPDVLLFEGFEDSQGKFSAGQGTKVVLDKANTYLNGGSLHVQASQAFSNLSIGFTIESWDLNVHDHLSFAYRIVEGSPVGVRVKTPFGDWVCLGGTKAYKCGSARAKEEIVLIDDGQWHESSFKVTKPLHTVLSAIDHLGGFQFFTNGNANETHEFWLDDFKAKK